MAINKVVYAGETLIDTSEVTVTAETLLTGYTALDASGTLITGTATGTNNASIPLMFELGELNSSTGAIEASTIYAHSQLINIITFKEYTIYIDTTVAGTTGTIRVYSYYSDGSLALRGDSTPFANGSIVLSFPTNAASFRIRVYDSNKYGDTLLNECNNGITLKATGGASGSIPTVGDNPVVENADVARVNTTSLSSTGISITIPADGSYRLKWTAFRNNTSGTWSTQLYKNGTAVGTEVTTWTQSYYQNNTLDLECAAGDVITVYARARSTSYYCTAGNLSACVAETPIINHTTVVDAVMQDKTITENGTYTPDDGFNAFSSVIVNVPAASLPSPIVAGDTPVLYCHGIKQASSESLKTTNLSITVPLAGTYRFKWCSSTDSDSIKTQLYQNGVAVGTQQSSSSSSAMFSLDLECAAGDVVTLYLAGYRYIGDYYGVAGGLCACIEWDNGF